MSGRSSGRQEQMIPTLTSTELQVAAGGLSRVGSVELEIAMSEWRRRIETMQTLTGYLLAGEDEVRVWECGLVCVMKESGIAMPRADVVSAFALCTVTWAQTTELLRTATHSGSACKKQGECSLTSHQRRRYRSKLALIAA
jgi:hypothetical protein